MFTKILKAKLNKVNSSYSYEFKFPDQTFVKNGDQTNRNFRVIFTNQKSLRQTIFGGELGFCESYIYGHLDIEGSIPDFIKFARILAGKTDGTPKVTLKAKLYDMYHELRYGNSTILRAVTNAKFHYNRGSEDLFFKYLDSNSPYNVAPTYTCAYWKEGTKNLDEAQFNKLDHVCRKVQLSPGDSLIDVGGGWGSLLFHALERYDISYGLNISPTPDQNRWMQDKIYALGLSEKIKIKEADFRQIEGLEGSFDKYISTGVYEHAGKPQLEAWIESMAKVLKPGGKGVLHFIGKQDEGITHAFIRKHVFPGGYLPGLGETVDLMKKYGLEMLDVENLRRHYARTLTEWATNFDKNWPEIHISNPEKYDERFRRTWHLYLWLCVGAFERRDAGIGLYQITFSKGWTEDYPMSRTFLYEDVPQPTSTKWK